MGGGYYDRDDDIPQNQVSNSSSSNNTSHNKPKNLVGTTTSVHSSLDPTRWKENKLICDKKDPIVFALDVTGSMGEWTKIIYDKMPMFYGQIMIQKYLEDPSVSFCAIGDAKCDKAPLQVSEFGQGKEIDQLISKIYLEGGGGGNIHESYELSAYFYSRRCSLTNAKLPFFFVTGDENFWELTTTQMFEKVLNIKEVDQKGDKLWHELMKKFNVFHIKKAYKRKTNKDEIKIDKKWKSVLGKERVLHISEPKACIDVVLGAIALTSGARTLSEYLNDMKIREQTKERIKEVSEALKLYSDALLSKKIIPVEYIPSLEETLNTDRTLKVDQNLREIREISEKLLVMSLESDEDKKYLQGLKDLSKSMEGKIPKEFLCPITGELFYEPVVASDLITYEKVAIQTWILKHDSSPVTGNKFDSKDFIPNVVIKKLVKEFYISNQ